MAVVMLLRTILKFSTDNTVSCKHLSQLELKPAAPLLAALDFRVRDIDLLSIRISQSKFIHSGYVFGHRLELVISSANQRTAGYT